MSAYDFSQPVVSDLVLVPEYGTLSVSLEGVKSFAMKCSALDQLKAIFPIGTELDDTDPTNASANNPWLIANYEIMQDTSGTSRLAVAIIRKYLNSITSNIAADDWYGSSTERTYLEGSYWQNCSNEAKQAISPVSITFLPNVKTTSTIFLPSATNMCLLTVTSQPTSQTMGNLWELFGGVATNNNIASRKCALGNNHNSYQQYITRDNSPTTAPYRWSYASVSTAGGYADTNDDITPNTYLRPAAYILGAKAE